MTLFVVYALTLLVGWQEGHLAVKYLHEQSTIHVFGGVELAWGDIWPVQQTLEVVVMTVVVAAADNNNNNQDDIYSAVSMTEVIVIVHLVHLVNVEQRQVAADPQSKPPDLGRKSACFRWLSSTNTIAICYR